MKCQPCGKEFQEREIENYIEEHDVVVTTKCHICETNLNEDELEDHIKASHKKELQQCEKCPKTYISSDHMKRHIWMAHTPTECSLCHHKQKVGKY